MRSVTVLLVEDDAEVARLMQKWGYDATHVLTSREAVDFAVLHQSEIALVVCDVNQGVSGPAVARGICPRTKTLVSSGSPFDVLCEDGLMTWETPQNGDTCYIQKPFVPKDLSIAIYSPFEPASEGPRDASQTGIRCARVAY